MIISNFRFAFRQLTKNMVFSLVNILGLSLSMVACLLIYKYVSFEKSFDNYQVGSENIYRIYRIDKGEDPNDGVASVFSDIKISNKQYILFVNKRISSSYRSSGRIWFANRLLLC